MNRTGFSLIEVILATAILMGSVLVLSELAGIGRRQSRRAGLHAQARQLCEQTLNEVLTGERPGVLVEDQPLLPPESILSEFEDQGRPVVEEEEQLLIFETPDEQAARALGGDDAAAEWRYSVRIAPLTELPGLAAITVSVVQADEELNRPVSFKLTRWAKAPPSLEGDDEAAPRNPTGISALGSLPGGNP